MNELYVCDTPYQVFNVLNIVFNAKTERNGNYSGNKDLFIINQFKTAESLKQKIQKSGLFTNVYLLRKDDTKFLPVGVKRNIRMSLDFLSPDSFLRQRFLDYNTSKIDWLHYGKVYGSGAYSTIAAIMKLNPKAEFVLYDDGIGSYSDDIIVKSSGGKLNRIFCKLFHVGSTVCAPSSLLVNNVALCKSTSVSTDKILPLPAFSQEFLTFSNEVFDVELSNNNRVYWLSQPLDCQEGAEKTRDKIRVCLSQFNDKIVVRMHPRDLDYNYYSEFQIDYGQDFWELSVLNHDTDNMVLLGSYSSAQVTPKLLFDKEPASVFLFMLNDYMSEERKRQLNDKVEELRCMYRDPEKIIVPNNIDELNDVLLSCVRIV